jgi:hypothetical protein
MMIETDDRLVRVERACERLHERFGVLEQRLTAIEPRLASGIVSLGYELKSTLDTLRAELRTGDARLEKQGRGHSLWLVILMLAMLAALLVGNLGS